MILLLKNNERLQTMDFNLVKRIPDEELAKHGRLGLQIGYQFATEPVTEKERSIVQAFKEDSQDLSCVKLDALDRLPVSVKEELIDHFCVAESIPFKPWLIENAFVLNKVNHEDGSLFMTITDFDCGCRLMAYNKILEELEENEDTFSIPIPEIEFDRHGFYLNQFKQLLFEKFTLIAERNGNWMLHKK